MNNTISKGEWNRQFISLDIFIYRFNKMQSRNLDQYSSVDIEKIHDLIKDKFYDKTQYKWQVKKAYKYISSQIYGVDPDRFILFLKTFFNHYYSNNKKGKKGAFGFLLKLENKENIKISQYNFGGIQLKEKTDVMEFLKEMKVLKSHLNISHNNFVKFISANFQTNLSSTTLRKYYYDFQL